MESDGQIASEMPRIVGSSIKSVGLEIFLASAACYLSYRLVKYIYIKQKVAYIFRENKIKFEAITSKIVDIQSLESGQNIVKLPWNELTMKLKNGELTASSVLKAYQAAAVDVHKRTNCIVGWIEEAKEQAQLLDDLPPEKRGPLHGVPVSVKECYDVAGTYSTVGMTKFARNESNVDCPTIKLIKSLGGVPFCKTNVPQVMYSLQCSNPIYGATSNPHMSGRECGGSSGGEGALIGGGGSVLGLGSDIGGSLRNPAAFCGIYSLKPSAGRHLSQLGVACGAGPPVVGAPVVGGFMSNSAEALVYCWKEVWGLKSGQNCQMVDTSVLPIMWNQELFDNKPRIGYYVSDGLLDPASGCVRAVEEAVTRLTDMGYDVKVVPPPNIRQVIHYFNGIVLADLNNEMYKNMKYDVYDSTLNGVVAAISVYKLPWVIKKLIINPLLSLLTRIPPIATVFNLTSNLAEALASRDKMTRDYLATLDNYDVDIILTPSQLLPAPPTGVLGTFVAPVITYIPWSLMNFPAGIAPVTRWNEEDNDKMSVFPTDDIAYKMMKNYCQNSEGLPLAVQVVGRPYKDEQVLKILLELENSRNQTT